jgi:hypothetical protein
VSPGSRIRVKASALYGRRKVATIALAAETFLHNHPDIRNQE